jgi:hypothetical protein
VADMSSPLLMWNMAVEIPALASVEKFLMRSRGKRAHG